jgi:hypothetical protein
VRRADDGTIRLHSQEHPGLYITWLESDRLRALLFGLPHALLLRRESGDFFVLLSALDKPCRLANARSPLDCQMIIARHAQGWAASLPSSRHYLYSYSRSNTHLTAPSLSAALYLLVLRWLARDYVAAFALCGACISDAAFNAEETQLWELIGDLAVDLAPESHACRLKLSVASRCCPELRLPWQPAVELELYLEKLRFIGSSCRLSATDELLLLREFGGGYGASRLAFLEASMGLGERTSRGAHLLRPVSSALPPLHDFDRPLDLSALLAPEAPWMKRMAAISYSKQSPATGVAAIKALDEWLSSGIDAEG